MIYLMRHGLTASNRKNIYAGWGEEPLLPEGEAAIRAIGRKLIPLDIRQIFTSPIRRARHTAETIKAFFRVGIKVLDDLKEIKMGPWEGLSEADVVRRFPKEWKTWNETPSRLKMEGRETLEELQQRALRAIDSIQADPPPDGNVLAVSHVALIRVLLIHAESRALDEYRTIDVPNGSVFRLDPQMTTGGMARLL